MISPCSSAQQLFYCPGPVTISCSTVTPIIWDGTAFNGQCPLNGIGFQTIDNDSIGKSSSCGELNVTITNVVTTIDVGSTVVIVNSSLSFSAQPSLSGLTVVCRSGANAAVNSMLLIPGRLIIRHAWLTPLYIFVPSCRSHSGCVCEPGLSDSCDSDFNGWRQSLYFTVLCGSHSDGQQRLTHYHEQLFSLHRCDWSGPV